MSVWFLQVMLINSVKDVASALSDLIETTKNAAGKPSNDPAMNVLKESAKANRIGFFYVLNFHRSTVFGDVC